jgi:hypothetical protein
MAGDSSSNMFSITVAHYAEAPDGCASAPPIPAISRWLLDPSSFERALDAILHAGSDSELKTAAWILQLHIRRWNNTEIQSRIPTLWNVAIDVFKRKSGAESPALTQIARLISDMVLIYNYDFGNFDFDDQKTLFLVLSEILFGLSEPYLVAMKDFEAQSRFKSELIPLILQSMQNVPVGERFVSVLNTLFWMNPDSINNYIPFVSKLDVVEKDIILQTNHIALIRSLLSVSSLNSSPHNFGTVITFATRLNQSLLESKSFVQSSGLWINIFQAFDTRTSLLSNFSILAETLTSFYRICHIFEGIHNVFQDVVYQSYSLVLTKLANNPDYRYLVVTFFNAILNSKVTFFNYLLTNIVAFLQQTLKEELISIVRNAFANNKIGVIQIIAVGNKLFDTDLIQQCNRRILSSEAVTQHTVLFLRFCGSEAIAHSAEWVSFLLNNLNNHLELCFASLVALIKADNSIFDILPIDKFITTGSLQVTNFLSEVMTISPERFPRIPQIVRTIMQPFNEAWFLSLANDDQYKFVTQMAIVIYQMPKVPQLSDVLLNIYLKFVFLFQSPNPSFQQWGQLILEGLLGTGCIGISECIKADIVDQLTPDNILPIHIALISKCHFSYFSETLLDIIFGLNPISQHELCIEAISFLLGSIDNIPCDQFLEFINKCIDHINPLLISSLVSTFYTSIQSLQNYFSRNNSSYQLNKFFFKSFLRLFSRFCDRNIYQTLLDLIWSFGHDLNDAVLIINEELSLIPLPPDLLKDIRTILIAEETLDVPIKPVYERFLQWIMSVPDSDGLVTYDPLILCSQC